jgi:hypothetical protein
MNNNGNGQATVLPIKRKMEPLVPAADFSEVIMQLVGDPNCKTCYGRFWVGFLKQPDGATTLQVCHCASFAETQVVTVLRAVAVMANDQDASNKAIIEILARTEKTQSAILEMLKPKPNALSRAIEYVKHLKAQVDAHNAAMVSDCEERLSNEPKVE